MNNDTLMSSASVEYTRGLRKGEELGYRRGLEEAIILLGRVETRPDGTYKVGIAGYSSPFDAIESVIQKVLNNSV